MSPTIEPAAGQAARNAAEIARLNDAFRSPGLVLKDWVVSAGVEAKGAGFVQAATIAVQDYDRFDAGNDPYQERDFGSFELEGEPLFWKIDYYDLELKQGSPDPADPTVTRRVLTIMLASEY